MRTLFIRSTLLSGALLLAACNGSSSETGDPETNTGLTLASSSSSSAGMTLDTIFNDPDGTFFVRYPANWETESSNTIVTPTGESEGIAFMVPQEVFTGSVLTEARIHVALEDVCPQLSDAQPVTLEGETFTHGTWSDAGAGNLYSGDVYTRQTDIGCAVITLYEHRCNLGEDCGEGRNAAFMDQDMLEETARAIAASFVLATEDETDGVACTMDAKLCPDGSYVGRTPPTCAFEKCPGE